MESSASAVLKTVLRMVKARFNFEGAFDGRLLERFWQTDWR